jgi:hypothetical protein
VWGVDRLSATVFRGILPGGIPEYSSSSVLGHVADIFDCVQELKLASFRASGSSLGGGLQI